jgi:hypothetical protein
MEFSDPSFQKSIAELHIPIDPYFGMSFEKNSEINNYAGMPLSLKFGLGPLFAFVTETTLIDLKFDFSVVPAVDISEVKVYVQGIATPHSNGQFSIELADNSTKLIQLDVKSYSKLGGTVLLLWKTRSLHVFQKVPIDSIYGMDQSFSLGLTNYPLVVLPSTCHQCDILVAKSDFKSEMIELCVKPQDIYGNIITLQNSSDFPSNFLAFVSSNFRRNSACKFDISKCDVGYLGIVCPAYQTTDHTVRFLNFQTAALYATYYDSMNFTQPVSVALNDVRHFYGEAPPADVSPSDWSVRWAGFIRGGPTFRGNITASVQLKSDSPDSVRLWVDGLLMIDVLSAGPGTNVSVDFSLALKDNPLYEIILEYSHTIGPYNLTFSVSDPFSTVLDDVAFESWSAVCPNHSNGTAVFYPYVPPVVYDRAVVWQPSTVWTVGLPVDFRIRTVDSFGNLSNKILESYVFFCFVTGFDTSTDVAEINNYRLPLATRWVVCAIEGQQCFFSGAQVVGYGSRGVPFVFKQAIDRILCNSESFNVSLRGDSSMNQCYLSAAPLIFVASKYKASSVGLVSPSERLNLFVTFRNASAGIDLALFSSPDCSPHSLVARTKRELSFNCSDLKKIASFQCLQLDGALAFSESGVYDIGMWTSDDVMVFMGSDLVLRSSPSLTMQFYSLARYFDSFDTVLLRISIVPSSEACTTSFVWKLSIPGLK